MAQGASDTIDTVIIGSVLPLNLRIFLDHPRLTLLA